MEKFKVTAGMLFSLECEITAESHQEAVERMMGFIEAAYKDEAIYDEVNGTEFLFIKPTTVIVEDEEGNAQRFQFKNGEEEERSEEEDEDTVTRCDNIEDHIRALLNGEGNEVYDEYTKIALSEDKESVIVTDNFKTKTFKISDYKELVYLVIAIDGFLYNN